jgi:hypothetical protein
MIGTHTPLHAHADPIRALAETCALLGRKGWAFTTETTEPTVGGSGATVLRSHALLRTKRPEGFGRGDPMDTFVVLVATTMIPAYGSAVETRLSGYLIGFPPRLYKEGPIVHACLAENIDADLYPDWAPQDGFWTPAAFADCLAGVVSLRLVSALPFPVDDGRPF